MRKIRRWKLIAGITVILTMGGLLGSAFLSPARAIDLGDILTIGGVILVVSTFGDQINNFINSALAQREVEVAGASKVVPIFSVGRGAYIGAAQVMGVPSNVREVQGVAAVELSIGNLSGAGLLPITTRRPGRTIDQVNGVGISAIMDFRL